MPPGQEQPWLLITIYNTAPEPKGYSDRLQDFLSAEKKTMDDLQTILGNTGTSPESIIRGLTASKAKRASLEKFIRGAVASDLMLVQLRLKERRTKPPNFLDLLSEIRVEEEYGQNQGQGQNYAHLCISADKETDKQERVSRFEK